MAKAQRSGGSFEEIGGGTSTQSAGLETESGDGLVVDLSGVDEQGDFKPIPRGIYPCMLEEMEYGLSQSSGNPMWTTVWAIEEGHELHGKGRFWLHLTFTEGGMPRVKKALARMVTESGIEKNLLKGRFNPEKIADEGVLLGARAKLRINIKKYQGVLRNNVQDILPPDAAGAGGGFGKL